MARSEEANWIPARVCYRPVQESIWLLMAKPPPAGRGIKRSRGAHDECQEFY